MADKQKTQKSVEPPAFTITESELNLVDLALAEDKGASDWTTRWIVPARSIGSANIVAKTSGIISGIGITSVVFTRLDPRVEMMSACPDGAAVSAGEVVCSIKGPARVILTGERTALNFLQRLSGIATLTRKYVDAVAGTNVAILDTRKTTPAWRALERAAVRAGGGYNHRTALDELVLIKENHIAVAGSISEAIRRVKDGNTKGLKVEVEVRDKDELKAAVEAGCDRVLLDNMDVQAIRECVRVARKIAPSVAIEASGNMTLERVRTVAEAGVDFISVGALTHSAPALDLSLQIKRG
jgi:nicotinate-nucleotide pyrophosphorylase (carboxylating)